MALVQGEIDICNLSYDRIGSLIFELATQATDPLGIRANRAYPQRRKALLRSFDWPFAREREQLSQLYTLDLDAAPTSAWAVDDNITGDISITTTSRIIEVVSTTSFIITTPVDADGDAADYTDGEILTNLTGTRDCAAGYPVVAAYVPAFGPTTAFALPQDFLGLLRNDSEDPSDYPSQRGRVEGRKYLFDADTTCNLKYIKDFTDTTLFDTLFVDVLVLQLALAFLSGTAGTGKIGFKQELKDDLKLTLRKVRAYILQENNVTGRSDWNYARYGLAVFPQSGGL